MPAGLLLLRRPVPVLLLRANLRMLLLLRRLLAPLHLLLGLLLRAKATAKARLQPRLRKATAKRARCAVTLLLWRAPAGPARRQASRLTLRRWTVVHG